jgi:hypothetical protein
VFGTICRVPKTDAPCLLMCSCSFGMVDSRWGSCRSPEGRVLAVERSCHSVLHTSLSPSGIEDIVRVLCRREIKWKGELESGVDTRDSPCRSVYGDIE